MGIKKKTTNRTRGASRVAGGGTLRLGQGTGPTRTTQRRRVGGLRPKLHSIGVAGEFGDVVESAKMDDADAGRARQHPSGPTMPWRVPGAHVVDVGGSHGDRVGRAVSVVTLVQSNA